MSIHVYTCGRASRRSGAPSGATSYDIIQSAKRGELDEACASIESLVHEVAGVTPTTIELRSDAYSLNSVNGRLVTTDGTSYFFKFHAEEEEESTVDEYYQGSVLADAGLPVDLPVFSSTTPGQQLLLYRFREDAKLVDVCLAVEQGLPAPFSIEAIDAAQQTLDQQTYRVATQHLRSPESTRSPAGIHQLFHNRLHDPDTPHRLGGRYQRFYNHQDVILGDHRIPWEQFEQLRWRVNGVQYVANLRELFEASLETLAPEQLALQSVTTAHGDAHNANVWIEEGTEPNRAHLTTYDPAFAGTDLPVLLAEIKATFHNIFAHPFWLYSPTLVPERCDVQYTLSADVINISHTWTLGPLRERFLRSKIENYWRPLIAHLRARGQLPTNAESIIRLAFFCCPMLVTSLMPSPSRPYEASLLGFATAIAAGSPPIPGGDDLFTRFFTEISVT